MTPIKETASTAFHIVNYLDLSIRMNRMPFFLLNLGMAFILAPILLSILPEGFLDAPADTPVPLLARVVIEGHNLILLPAFIKRMKDVGWSSDIIQIISACIYAPAVLKICLSEGFLSGLTPFLALAGLAVAMVTFYLFVAAGDENKNDYGPAPRRQ